MRSALLAFCLVGVVCGASLTRVGFNLRNYVATRPTVGQFENLTGQALVEHVNLRQNLWKAGPTKFSSLALSEQRQLMGVNRALAAQHLAELPRVGHADFAANLQPPAAFDARQQWPDCASIGHVRDQSSCGSCWAFGAVEAMSDRVCIASGGKLNVAISAADLLSCCDTCGFGCYGGSPAAAWSFWRRNGIVTGSDYNTHEGCWTYPFEPCEHHSNKTHYPACPKNMYDTPKCRRTCETGYQTGYSEDKFFGKKVYRLNTDEEVIRKELMTNGPVEVDFDVYADFLNYQSGIYTHQGGAMVGGHAVRLLGWGEEDGVPYWLLANSWNEDWGENGFFRVVRGANECGIEADAIGGEPDAERSPALRSVLSAIKH